MLEILEIILVVENIFEYIIFFLTNLEWLVLRH